MSSFYLNRINTNDSTSLLSVDPDTYAELMSYDSETYKFSFSFKMKLNDGNKNIKDYEKVVITVKSKKISNDFSRSSNVDKENSDKVANKVDQISLQDYVKPEDENRKSVIIPDSLAKKMFSGLKVVKDSLNQEVFIDKKEVSISTYVDQVNNNKFSYYELIANSFSEQKETKRTRDISFRSGKKFDSQSSRELDPNVINPSNLLARINQDKYDITLPVTDKNLSLLTSESLIDDSNIRMREVYNGKRPLYFDIVKFYLDFNASPEEKNMVSYTVKRVVKSLDFVEIKQEILLKKINKDDTLAVNFSLFKRDSSEEPDETLNQDLNVYPHVEAFESIIKCPEVSTTKIYGIDSSSLAKTSKKLYNITITDQDKSGRVDSFNLYLKSVYSSGEVTGYTFLKNLKNTGLVKTDLEIFEDISFLRVIPVDSMGRESNVFTNLFLGEGYKTLASVVCIPYHYGKNEIKIDVLGLPEKTTKVAVYRKDCTDNVDGSFSLVESVVVQKGASSVSFVDKQVVFSRTYEYYAVVVLMDEEEIREISLKTNFSTIRNLSNGIPEKPINVFFTDPTTIKNSDGTISTSFNIKTEITPTENERITKTLKEQIGELYEQFLNPLANTTSPLGDNKGVPQYADLLIHEVVRYDLKTGEKETFDLVSDGIFNDNTTTQKKSNVSPINQYREYEYKIFTFRKNPIELFKNYVAKGVDSKSKKREWFYSPYKWKSSSVKLGKLNPQNEKEEVIIDTYDNFTSECYGVTATYTASPYSKLPTIEKVYTDRVDRNTVKIFWSQNNSLSYQTEFFDSFVVMKVVNRVKSFVGRTISNFIYHELSEKDLGTVYYIVIPITSNFSIDKAAYSDSILITPEGLTEKIKIPSGTISKNTTNL